MYDYDDYPSASDFGIEDTYTESEFMDWYNDLDYNQKGEMLKYKTDRKQGWYEFFRECFHEHLEEEAEYQDYIDSIRYGSL